MGLDVLLSIKDRRALSDPTGDPWDGRTLEWLTSSPPAEYNFAGNTRRRRHRRLYGDEGKGRRLSAAGNLSRHRDAEKRAPTVLIIGALAFVFGFAMIWYVWWLAILAALGILATVIARAMDDDIYYIIPAAEVKRIEDERYRQLAAAGKPTSPAPVPET